MKNQLLIFSFVIAFAFTPAQAHEFEHVAGFPEIPSDWKNLGNSHGEIAVASNGEIYVSVQSGKKPGIQVFSAEGKYLRNVEGAPNDFHGFVIYQEAETEYIYGVGLLSGTLTKMKLDGSVVFATPHTVIPEKFLWKKEEKLNPRFTSCIVAPDGTIYVADGYASDNIHLFNKDGSYRSSWVGRDEAFKFRNLHKIALDLRYDEPRILGCDRNNRRLVHLSLDGKFIGEYASGLRRPSAVSFHGSNVAIAEIEGNITVLDKEGNVVTTMGTHHRKYKGNWAPPKQWKEGIVNSPHGITYDAEGNILMTEYSKFGRILKYTPLK